MTQLINDSGFVPQTTAHDFIALSNAANDTRALDVTENADPNALPLTPQIMRIAFPSSADGRGFTIARILRLRGYRGTLRAYGHVLADQYAMARRSGFDEVEIPDDLAARQPEEQWLFRADWRAHDYQSRLRASA